MQSLALLLLVDFSRPMWALVGGIGGHIRGIFMASTINLSSVSLYVQVEMVSGMGGAAKVAPMAVTHGRSGAVTLVDALIVDNSELSTVGGRFSTISRRPSVLNVAEGTKWRTTDTNSSYRSLGVVVWPRGCTSDPAFLPQPATSMTGTRRRFFALSLSVRSIHKNQETHFTEL